MYWQMMTKAATKLQTKCTDRMILPSSSQKYLWTYLRLRRSWETNRWKVWFSLLSNWL